MIFSLQVALRFLKSSKGQTALIITGIAVGVAVMVFIGALINGLQQSIIQATIGSTSQISIYYEPLEKDKDKVFRDYEKIINKAKSMNLGITGITATLNRNGFALFKNATEPAQIKGVHLQTAENIYKLKEKTVSGRLLLRKKEVVIGIDLANKLGLNLGDTLIVRTPYGKETEFTLVGTIDFGAENANETSVIAEIEDVQRAFDLKDEVSRIEMQIDDVFQADQRAETLRKALGKTDLTVNHWKEENKSLLTALQSQSSSTYIIQVCVLLSVLLGIASVLMISVVQKSKQIGILKAMGISQYKAGLIFLFQGAILGVLGSGVGISFAFGLLKLFERAALSGGQATFNISYDLSYMLQVAGLSVICAIFASFVPTFKTRSVDPIDVIRNN